MRPIEAEQTRDRVHSLRARLSDTTHLLETVANTIQRQDNDTRTSLRTAISEIHTVIDDLEAVCGDRLSDPMDRSMESGASDNQG